jgi:quinol monooxygenase YgiN
MSVLVIATMQGDTAKFRQAVVDRAEEFARIAERARGPGALHHRFGIGNGQVVVCDEWESADQFEKFFSDPDLQAFVASVGGDTSSPPDISISEALTSVDQF